MATNPNMTGVVSTAGGAPQPVPSGAPLGAPPTSMVNTSYPAPGTYMARNPYPSTGMAYRPMGAMPYQASTVGPGYAYQTSAMAGKRGSASRDVPGPKVAAGGKADKRAHHNALERKRRDHIKDSFTMLRDTIPSINGEKQVQVSRAQILNKATDYIQYMRKRNQAHQAEMEELRRQNASLQMQSQMQHAKSEEDGEDIKPHVDQ